MFVRACPKSFDVHAFYADGGCKFDFQEKHLHIQLPTSFIAAAIHYQKWVAPHWEKYNLIFDLLYLLYYLNFDHTFSCN